MKILTSFLTALLFHLSSLTACPEDTIGEQKVPEIVKEEAESKGHENSLKTIDEVIEGIDSLLDDIDRTSGVKFPLKKPRLKILSCPTPSRGILPKQSPPSEKSPPGSKRIFPDRPLICSFLEEDTRLRVINSPLKATLSTS